MLQLYARPAQGAFPACVAYRQPLPFGLTTGSRKSDFDALFGPYREDRHGWRTGPFDLTAHFDGDSGRLDALFVFRLHARAPEDHR